MVGEMEGRAELEAGMEVKKGVLEVATGML